MNIRPLGAKVLVKQDPSRGQIGLIFTPQGSEEFDNYATVLAVGPGVLEDIKIGDRVLFKRQPGSALWPDSRDTGGEDLRDLLMLKEESIVGIITEES